LKPKQNMKSKKALMYKQCVSTARCHMVDWCNRLVEEWPWSPLSSSFTKAITTVTVRELSDTTSYYMILHEPSFLNCSIKCICAYLCWHQCRPTRNGKE
jgi:hypothetical protein